MKLRFTKLDARAAVPVYATPDSAGADLVLLPGESVTIAPGESRFAHTGLALEIPAGYVGLVYARSGLACKKGIAPANKVGVIDADYRGEIMVCLHNHGQEPVTLAGGDRIAQLVIAPVVQAEFEEAPSLTDTSRGGGGFGSTGMKA